MNIYDISKEAGVSIATVSRVINGTGRVSEKTREKVLSIMEKHNYTPNIFARSLCQNSLHIIGILCGDSSDPYMATSIYYLERDLRQQGYDSILCCTGYDPKTKAKYTSLLLSKKVDALIFVGSTFVDNKEENNNYIKEAAKQVPVMMINGYIDFPNIWGTLCDDYNVSYKITTKLLKENREHLLFLYHSPSFSSLRKMDAFKKAHEDIGISFTSSQFLCMDLPVEQAVSYLQSAYGTMPFFNGILTTSDELAAISLKYIKKCGLHVPDSIFIIGYNNSKLSKYVDPELSTIDNKPELICQTAVKTLMECLSGKNPETEITIESEFIERGTTMFK